MKQRRDYKSKRVHKKNQKELIGYFQKPKGSHTHCVVDRASEEKFKIGYISEDRKKEGLILIHNVIENSEIGLNSGHQAHQDDQ